MKNFMGRFVKSEDGVTALEYGLIAGLIAIMIIGGATKIGTNLQSVFTTIGDQMSTASTAATAAAAKTD